MRTGFLLSDTGHLSDFFSLQIVDFKEASSRRLQGGRSVGGWGEKEVRQAGYAMGVGLTTSISYIIVLPVGWGGDWMTVLVGKTGGVAQQQQLIREA